MAVLAPQQDGFRKPLPGMWCVREREGQGCVAQGSRGAQLQPRRASSRRPGGVLCGVLRCLGTRRCEETFRQMLSSLSRRNLVMDSHNGGVKPDLSNSFFVGDAAGRDGDHSDADMCAPRKPLSFARERSHSYTPH